MKRKTKEVETMRPEYDFSNGVRGVAARRVAKGGRIVVVSPEVLDVFPDDASINAVLKALAPVIRKSRRSVRRQRSA
jgi:hypothetical protein